MFIVVQILFDHDDQINIPYMRSKIEEVTNEVKKFRTATDGEVANQHLHLPIILPKFPGRFYYYFGKPIETEGRSEELRDGEKSRELYLQVQAEVEKCLNFS
ncbi:hypothetical protein Patl1_03103 [Pistacia atlantica]|uniref:Uncharacterized protein n=1 Tax=Pistacia atlantica TaxID=434234 RepID=A0ACC1CCP5_9ROSI|nr:hypothetical protein Patl1_03103 [Pistacia atlantica]